MKQISLFEQNITSLEKKMVMESLDKNQISTYGYFTNLFVKEVKKITSSKYNLATNSGSSALFLAFKSVAKPIAPAGPAQPKDTYKVASGTGFYVSDQGHFITNHHVIDGCV